MIASALVAVELIEETAKVQPPRILRKAWKYREAALQFMLGTLLNSYAIFYFTSASAFTSLAFIAVLVALLTLHEFKRFDDSKVQVHVALLSLCMISFLVSLLPMI